jgi:hypothetical protein
VIESIAPKPVVPKRSGVSIWFFIIGLFVAALAVGMYLLVGPK